MDGIERIAAERRRQVEAEGWTPSHDDKHVNGELAIAAVCYASPEPLRAKRPAPSPGHRVWPTMQWQDPWPWDAAWDKRGKHDRIRQLTIAGALIAAEIDRLRRAEDRAAGLNVWHA